MEWGVRRAVVSDVLQRAKMRNVYDHLATKGLMPSATAYDHAVLLLAGPIAEAAYLRVRSGRSQQRETGERLAG